MAASAGDVLGLPYLIYGQRARLTFPLLDADGDLVTGAGASTPDSEVSKDQGTFADCTNEMTEIASGSGVYYLDLVQSETQASSIAVIAKSAAAGMKTTTLVVPVRRLPVLRSGTAQAGAAGTITLDSGASAKDDFYNGMIIQCSNNTPTNVQGQTRWIIDYVGSTKVATVHANWGTNPSSSTTFEVYVPETANMAALLYKEIADPTNNGVLEVDVTHYGGTAGTFASGRPEVNMTHIAGSAVSTSTAQLGVNVVNFGGSAGTFASGRPEVNTTHIAGSAVSTSSAQIGVNVVNAGGTAWASGSLTSGVFASGAITAGAIAADAIGASELAADAVTEIRSLVSGTSDSGTTTTMVDAARTEADDDYWKGALIVFTSGNIAGQARVITGFTASSDTITFAPATTQAVSTQTYEIWPTGDFLRPTVSGRTLDVTTGGEAGVDWNNIGTPTATQNLSGTTISTSQAIASVSGAVGSVTGAVGSVTGNVGGNVSGNVTGSVGSLATQAKADVNAEVDTALASTNYGEPSQGAPGASISLVEKIGYLYAFLRNKITQDSTTLKVFADDGSTVITKATVSDSAGTYTRDEFISGA